MVPDKGWSPAKLYDDAARGRRNSASVSRWRVSTLIVDIRNGSNEVDGTFLYLTRAGGGQGAPLLQPRHHFLSLHTPSLCPNISSLGFLSNVAYNVYLLNPSVKSFRPFKSVNKLKIKSP